MESPEAWNPYRDRNRDRKAAAIVAILPPEVDANGVQLAADALEAAPAAARLGLARAAGVNEASERTWQRVVELARARKPQSKG